jgi:anti-anti-sigma factor
MRATWGHGTEMGSAVINTSQSADGSVRVEVRGEIDVQTSDRLRDVLVRSATRLRPTRIVVDLLHVTFIDSSGIGALAAGFNAARPLGVGFALSNPRGFVAQQLRQAGLSGALVEDG